MTTFDFIPDLHGQSTKLEHGLHRLGWRRDPSGWRGPTPDREIVFLGDFIDRGPDNRGTLHLVRSLIDAGKARAIMGNHELNALQYHTVDPDDGRPLRPRSERNTRQHASFLKEYPLGDPQTREMLGWMQSLPMFLEHESFRAVHACWDENVIARLRALTPDGVLSDALLLRSAGRDPQDETCALVEQTTKGPEHPLPQGYSFADKDGTRRRNVRLQWWNSGARTWRDIAMSVSDPSQLPQEDLPDSLRQSIYPGSAKPVFFGHYWLRGAPRLQAPNAICLDYSAGLDGPLVTFTLDPAEERLSLGALTIHDDAAPRRGLDADTLAGRIG